MRLEDQQHIWLLLHKSNSQMYGFANSLNMGTKQIFNPFNIYTHFVWIPICVDMVVRDVFMYQKDNPAWLERDCEKFNVSIVGIDEGTTNGLLFSPARCNPWWGTCVWTCSDNFHYCSMLSRCVTAFAGPVTTFWLWHQSSAYNFVCCQKSLKQKRRGIYKEYEVDEEKCWREGGWKKLVCFVYIFLTKLQY